MITVAPSPVPYPTASNGVVDSWQCVNRAPTATAVPAPVGGTASTQIYIPGYDCAVTHYSEMYPDPAVTTYATTSPAPAPSAYAGGYSPGDTGNWENIGPWFAALLAACVIGPIALKTLLRWIQEAFGSV